MITLTGECSQTADSQSLSCMDFWTSLQIQKINSWTWLMKRRKVSCRSQQQSVVLRTHTRVLWWFAFKNMFGLVCFKTCSSAALCVTVDFLCSSLTATPSPKIDAIGPIQSGDYKLFLIIAAQTKLCAPTVPALFCWSDSDLQQHQLAERQFVSDHNSAD